MCTLSWRRDPVEGLEVFFNRDELKTRPVADAPCSFDENGVAFLSPRDPQGMGTWMLASERGVVLCLLNRWELEDRAIKKPKSRGRLVWELAAVSGAEQVEAFLRGIELARYRAFTLVVFAPSGDRSFEWDGDTLTGGEVPAFLTSSSFRFEEVRAARASRFEEGLSGQDFHASPDESPSAYSVRMNRPDAQTWSRSHLRVTGRIRWSYLAEQADLQGEPEIKTVELSLR